MTQSARLTVGALGALYVLWLATWLVLSGTPYGFDRYQWDQTTAAAVTGIIAFIAAWRRPSPARGFLVFQGVAFLLLAWSWATYHGSSDLSATVASPQQSTGDQSFELSDWAYASCVFVLMCAWGYRALQRWSDRPLSSLTTLVFAASIAGLGGIFASFYYQQYSQLLKTASGRLDAVTAGGEFVVLAIGLLCILLKEPAVVVWMLVGTVILMAGDMAYSLDIVPKAIDAAWMLGQFLVLSAVASLAMTGVTISERSEPGRSSLSGILILVSLGAVLLSPLVWLLPVAVVWKSFLSVLFVVSLVIILVWITDRFDDTVAYIRAYVRSVHRSHLVSEDWRGTDTRIDTALRSTGLDNFLDEFRESAARLKRDVLFLGPERLYGPPLDGADTRKPSCFIVMPFRQEWSTDVHRILALACEEAGVRPVRGDDLFTPTDILEDIWQSINAADFVIADITARNPNVLYELGIAHTLAKPVLILSRDAADIPIDLATRRVILYGGGGTAWSDELTRTIRTAIANVVEDYGIDTRIHQSRAPSQSLTGV